MKNSFFLILIVLLASSAYSKQDPIISDNLKEDVWTVEDITYHIDNYSNDDLVMDTDGHHDITDAIHDFKIPAQSKDLKSSTMHSTLYNWNQDIKFKKTNGGDFVTFAGYYTDGKHSPDLKSHKFNYDPTTLDFGNPIGVRGKGHFFYNKDAFEIKVKSSTSHNIQDLCPDPAEVNAQCPIDVYSTDIYITIYGTIPGSVNTVDLVNDSQDILTIPTLIDGGATNTSIPTNTIKRIFLPIASSFIATDKEGNEYTIDYDFGNNTCSVENGDLALTTCSAMTSTWDEDVKSIQLNTVEHHPVNFTNNTSRLTHGGIAVIFDDKHHKNFTVAGVANEEIYMQEANMSNDYIATDTITKKSYHLKLEGGLDEGYNACIIQNPDERFYYCSLTKINSLITLDINNKCGPYDSCAVNYNNNTKYKLNISSKNSEFDPFDITGSTFWHRHDNWITNRAIMPDDSNHEVIITGKDDKQYTAFINLPANKCLIKNPDKDLSLCTVRSNGSLVYIANFYPSTKS